MGEVIEAVAFDFDFTTYMLLTLVRGLGGRIIKYLTVIQELHAVYPVFVVAPYEVKSKSNATDEIKQKLLLVHKNVFSRNFAHIYCRSEPTFQ